MSHCHRWNVIFASSFLSPMILKAKLCKREISMSLKRLSPVDCYNSTSICFFKSVIATKHHGKLLTWNNISERPRRNELQSIDRSIHRLPSPLPITSFSSLYFFFDTHYHLVHRIPNDTWTYRIIVRKNHRTAVSDLKRKKSYFILARRIQLSESLLNHLLYI